ncbi:type II toxin-antitoxin system RelE/ParE family toxin [Capnocytophaga leadbetteri]|jgi:putative stabilisation protein|uniref:type II toxin-antitoxin system RelE/ParE family toxin n=1 Tax=Capnocytophaga leadbetteri TaxID=327575 RepID=UPI0028E19D1F|nr:type II toxin-antitoxin system RelE/ParE family toxin [Capnocytophaga leadbetteri]
MVVEWTEQAKIELKEILLYWKKHNKSNSYSVKLNAEVQRVVKDLVRFPYLWTEVEGYENIRRALVFFNYSIFYLIEKNTITILSFWDNRRNPEELELFNS